MSHDANRRSFLKSSAATVAGLGLGGAGFTNMVSSAGAAEATSGEAKPTESPNEQIVLGWIGCGIRYHNLISGGCNLGPAAAICDVDAVQRGRAVQAARERHYQKDYPISIYDYEDYRRVLDRSDIDAVVIATPDHWHTKIAIEAMQAGKDVYCEKPLTLTIEEGRLINDAIAKTGRVLQVGTQQRTEVGQRFPTAVAMVNDGRVGDIRRVTCGIDGSPSCEPIPQADVPKHLNWDMWLGQAPMVDYRQTDEIYSTQGYGSGHPNSRTHNYFRWWYEYSGGKLTDWGAHHVDIAMWALGKSDGNIGTYTIDPIMGEHPVPFDSDGMPTVADRYNTATKFHVRLTFQDGVELDIRHNAPDLGFGNGVMFEGEKGRFFVNRGKLAGKAVEELETNPLPEGALEKLYGRPAPASHFADFQHCVKTRDTPISDAETHHRHLTACHATNIALRLNRKLTFDPAAERFVGDDQANKFLARTPRKGYEIG